jgi:hypothetical protein
VSNVITLDRKAGRVALDRGEVLLEFIEAEVSQRLNPNNEDCWS